MRVATLMKYVLDPEILSRDFALDFATGLPTTTFPSFQFDRYDRIALEIALNFRNSTGGAEVVSVCTGPDAAQDRLRETLAVKADNALLIETLLPFNDHERAAVFAAWAQSQDFSIVLCGRMTSDTDSSEAGPLLAEMLGWPLLSNVVKIEQQDGRIACQREVGEGYEWIFIVGPFVATATNAPVNTPRKAKLQDLMRAQRMPIGRVLAADFTLAPDVYIAIGISGAPQHVAGIAGAKLVIAINSDEQAPIFQWAHLGIVDDYRPVVAELIAVLRRRTANRESL